MSLVAIQQFNDQVASDETLQAKVNAAKTGKELVAIARRAGFDVASEDFRQFAQKLAKEELGAEKLEQVRGGVSGMDLGSGRIVDPRQPRGLAKRLLVAKGCLDEDVLQTF